MANKNGPARSPRRREAKPALPIDLAVESQQAEPAALSGADSPPPEPDTRAASEVAPFQDERKDAPGFDDSFFPRNIADPRKHPGKAAMAVSGLLGAVAGASLMVFALHVGWIPIPNAASPAPDGDALLRLATLEQDVSSARPLLDQAIGRLALSETAIKNAAAMASNALAVAEEAKSGAAFSSMDSNASETMKKLQQTQTAWLDGVDARMQRAEVKIGELQVAIDETHRRLAVVSQALEASRPDRAAALVVTLQRIDDAIQAGRPFKNELAAAQALSQKTETLNRLEPAAERGLPSADELARDFDQAMPAIRAALVPKPAASPGESGPVDRLLAGLTSDITITREGEPEPTGLEAPVAALRDHLRRGDVAQAVDAFAALPDPARQAGQAWLTKATPVADATALLRALSADALSLLSQESRQP